MSAFIRSATFADIPSIQAIGRATLWDTYPESAGFPPAYPQHMLDAYWQTEQFETAIHADDALLFVAEEAGQIVGMAEAAYLSPDHVIMWKLYVLQAFRGQRLGYALVKVLRTHLRPEVRSFSTEYASANLAAGKFYTACGFVFEKEIEEEDSPGFRNKFTYVKMELRSGTVTTENTN